MNYAPNSLAIENKNYPVDKFPPILRNVIFDLHTEMQIPIELIGSVTLGAVSLACQSLIEVIQPHTGMPEPCSLYLMTIAESGEGKTTINKQIMKPLYDFASEIIKEYEVNLDFYNSDYNRWKIKQQVCENNFKSAIRKNFPGEFEENKIKENEKLKPKRPQRPTFIYEDTTLKALVEGLNEHPEAGIISDEAVTFFKSHLKNNPGLLNKAWDNEIFDFRRANGEIYNIKPRLTFSLMSQPNIFSNYIENNARISRDSGFLSRFLFCKTNTIVVPSRENKNDNRDSLSNYYTRMNEILTEHKTHLQNTNKNKKQLSLTDKARELWQDYRTEIEIKTSLGGEWEHIKDIALKANSNLLRISAILQYFHSNKHSHIGPENLECTIDILNWYLSQASIIFYPMSERYQFEQDVRELFSWIKNRFSQNGNFAFPKNDISKYGPNRLRRLDKLTPVLNQLIAQGIICIAKFKDDSCLYITQLYKNVNYNDCFFCPPPKFSNITPPILANIIQNDRNTQGGSYNINLQNI
ncbi:YfjI family protein [Providencia rettgeri]|uniref:YfjI family protein n=1 Tax=Providencia rettgeri TaxID=587 RepID=UPI003016CD3E